jgi:hypothetical protein
MLATRPRTLQRRRLVIRAEVATASGCWRSGTARPAIALRERPTTLLPEIADCLRDPPDIVLDGELVVLDD